MQQLITILVFASVSTLVYAFFDLVFSEERQVARVLRATSEWEAEQAQDAEPLLKPFRHRVLSPAVHAMREQMRRVFPADARERTRHKLELAGDPGHLTPEGVGALQIIGAIALPILMIAVLAIVHVGFSLLSIVLVLLAGVGGYLAPMGWIEELRKRRHAKIRRALPDMLDMLTISVQAGLGFDMALVKLVRNATGPLAEEFGRMLAEVQAGGSRRDAFRHMGDRTEVPELDSFITAMVQADVFGVSISGILSAQSLELRKKRRQLVEEKAQKAPVKMVFPIIFCMLPATMLVVLGPAVIAIGRAFGVMK